MPRPIDCARRLLFGLLLVLFTSAPLAAEVPRVYPAGQTPHDARLGQLKDLNGYFPFTPSTTKEQWEARAAQVRKRILVANGLWPMPARTPANAVVHGKVERDTYTVERVYLESYPGHFVTGSLYRPKGKSGKLPAVLSPHGHWAGGRFTDAGVSNARKEIVAGAERFENGGRSPLQAKCVQLARMGCIVFHYDMVGYADSVQLPFDLAHGFSKQRPEFDGPENFGLFSTQAELRLQSIMGLQTYNTIRALDWLSELPDVDPARIGVTGASGGGTQTFILGAIDNRPAASFPAVMVSTGMQGGCTCENCSLLRIDTGNVEFAAMFGPRPQGMTGANDWTKEFDTKGFPELKQHYAMLGVPNNVLSKVMTQFGHNYNFVSREVMYHFFNKHLNLGLEEPVIEEDFEPLTIAEMTVWDDAHPRPPAGADYERSLTKYLAETSDQQIAALTPSDSATLASFREVVGGGVDVLIGRGLPSGDDVEAETKATVEFPEYTQGLWLVRLKPRQEELPVVVLQPKNWQKRAVVWAHEAGKSGLFDAEGKPSPAMMQLLAAGRAVIGADLLYQGEFLADGKPLTAARRVDNPREFAGYTLGYNPALFAQRVHDVLTLVTFAGNYGGERVAVDLLGFGAAGPWVAAARAQCGENVQRLAVDTGAFRFAKLASLGDLQFLPGGAKYGDLPGMLALGAPGELWLAGEGNMAPGLVSAAYTAAGAGGKLEAFAGAPAEREAAAVKWLTRP